MTKPRNYVCGPRHPRWNPDRTRVCTNCGKEFIRCMRRKRTAPMCSVQCYREWIAKHGREHRAPVGTLRQDTQGRTIIKLADGRWGLYSRYLVEQNLGRKLKSSEIVHHKDGYRSNNQLHNFQVVTQSQHMKIHREAEKIGLSVMVSNEWIPNIEGLGC